MLIREVSDKEAVPYDNTLYMTDINILGYYYYPNTGTMSLYFKFEYLDINEDKKHLGLVKTEFINTLDNKNIVPIDERYNINKLKGIEYNKTVKFIKDIIITRCFNTDFIPDAFVDNFVVFSFLSVKEIYTERRVMKVCIPMCIYMKIAMLMNDINQNKKIIRDIRVNSQDDISKPLNIKYIDKIDYIGSKLSFNDVMVSYHQAIVEDKFMNFAILSPKGILVDKDEDIEYIDKIRGKRVTIGFPFNIIFLYYPNKEGKIIRNTCLIHKNRNIDNEYYMLNDIQLELFKEKEV